MTGIFVIHCHVYDCSRLVTAFVFKAEAFHEFFIACGYLYFIDLGCNAVAGDFFYFTDSSSIDFLTVSVFKA